MSDLFPAIKGVLQKTDELHTLIDRGITDEAKEKLEQLVQKVDELQEELGTERPADRIASQFKAIKALSKSNIENASQAQAALTVLDQFRNEVEDFRSDLQRKGLRVENIDTEGNL